MAIKIIGVFCTCLNKKIRYQYQNKKYNLFEISQQNSDDLRTLKATAKLSILYKEGKYICFLPEDYLHMLNCMLFFEKNNTCCGETSEILVQIPAVRLTADMKGGIYLNYYNKPFKQNMTINLPDIQSFSIAFSFGHFFIAKNY